MQSKPQDNAIVCLTWTSMPLKKASDFRLCHNMMSRYTRHCPSDEETGAPQTQDQGKAGVRAAQSEGQAPRLVKRDYEILDILCSADAAGALPFQHLEMYATLGNEGDGRHEQGQAKGLALHEHPAILQGSHLSRAHRFRSFSVPGLTYAFVHVRVRYIDKLGAGEVVLSAFGHFTLLSFQLAKLLRSPISGRTGPHPKCTAQRLLLCPEVSRLFVVYGSGSESDGALPSRTLTRFQTPWQQLPSQHTCPVTHALEPSVTQASQHDHQRPAACRLGLRTEVTVLCALQALLACWPVVCRPSAAASQSCTLFCSLLRRSRISCQIARTCLPSSSRRSRQRARRL
jgi:hypothetical protein